MQRDRLPGLVALLIAAMAFAPVVSAQELVEAGAIGVKVFHFGGVRPMAGAQLQLVNVETAEVVGSATTDDAGNASFHDLPFGLYQLRASAPGYVDAMSPLMPLAASMSATSVVLELQERDDPAAAAGAGTAAAGGFTFLGLGGGGAIAALVGVIAAAGLAAYGIVEATNDSGTPVITP